MSDPSRELDKLKNDLIKEKETPSILLHSCCAPCSSYCIEYLSECFQITVFYYNPNIYPEDEYLFRKTEQQEFIQRFPAVNKVSFIEGDYDQNLFYETVKGLENEPERGARCTKCFELRLGKTANLAGKMGFDYFATTLTISPQKDSNEINRVGALMGEKYNATYLPTNFKKHDGYLRSVQLSEQYNIYRQNFCGCKFSIRDRV